MGWTGRIACVERIKISYKTLIQKPELKRQFLRPNFIWEVDTKTDGP